jgi:anti-anti-sigma factor
LTPTPLARLVPGDHACWFFRSPQEHREGVTAFVRDGLERGGKVVYLADAVPAEAVAGYLRAAGLDADGLAGRGRLVMRSLSDADVADGGFDPARQAALYGELAAQARKEGYRGLWVTGEASWQLTGAFPGVERYLEFERLVEELIAATEDALVLCQYDAAAPHRRPSAPLRSVHNLELAPPELRPLGRTVPGLSLVPAADGMAVSGEVDANTWAPFSNALRGLAERAADGREVVLDLTGLSFIDGHGAGLLARTARALGPSRRLVLHGAPPTLLRIAEILQLDREPGLRIEGLAGDARG